jgi:hypothetical protein
MKLWIIIIIAAALSAMAFMDLITDKPVVQLYQTDKSFHVYGWWPSKFMIRQTNPSKVLVLPIEDNGNYSFNPTDDELLAWLRAATQDSSLLSINGYISIVGGK